jgi:Ca2+-binding RTX toxin-like protein
MAKPSGNGGTGSSSYGRSLSYNGNSLTNPSGGATTFTKANDFLYITAAVGDDYTVATTGFFNGLGGSDQIIFKEDDLTIGDAYFTNFSSFEVVKLANDLDVDFTGSSLTLGDQAFEAGIREVTGGNGWDFIDFEADYDGVSVKVNGGAGEDYITTAGGDDTINGGDGKDTINGGDGNDTINGGADNDTINGDAGIDTINGGAGNDLIFGGDGADNITPGLGTDTIAYTDITNEGGDTITNFTTVADGAIYAAGDDVLQFSEADLFGLSGFAEYTGVGTSIDIDGDSSGPLLVEFVSGVGAQIATGAEAAFLFNQTTGELSFDADGTDAGGAIVIATLIGVTDLAGADFTFAA